MVPIRRPRSSIAADRRTTVDVLWQQERARFSAASTLALSKPTTDRPTFNGMEALVCMAVAMLMVVVADGVMLAQTRRHG